MTYSNELHTAIEIAQKAGEIQLRNQSKLTNIEIKEDLSPVTEVDKKCEDLIKKTLLSAFPDDGFFGEESDSIEGTSGRIWVVDPLDGTRPYIRGIPTYSILISLEEEKRPVVGVIHFPAKQETYSAGNGSGAFCNDKKISVSSTANLHTAIGSNLGLVETINTPEGKKLLGLMQEIDYQYGFMDAYSYMCVASGKLDLCVSLIDKPWDRSAAACIIKEAGGTFSDIYGNPTIYNDTYLISNGILHDSLVAHFK
jgi:histidinol phosphatase-like enzyme (inositol monophosphatase family)